MAEKSIGAADDIMRMPRLESIGDIEHWVYKGTRKVIANMDRGQTIKVVLDWNGIMGLETDTPTLQLSFENNILNNWEY